MLKITLSDFKEYISRLHLPESVAVLAFNSFKSHCQFLQTVQPFITADNELAAATFFIYKTIRKEKCCITLIDITRITGASKAKVWHMIKGEDTYLASSPQSEWDLIDKYCGLFCLSADQIRLVRAELKKSTHLETCSPLTKLCAAFHKIISQSGKKRTLKETSMIFGVSPSAVFRFRRRAQSQCHQ